MTNANNNQTLRPRPLDFDTPMPVIIQNDPDEEEELKKNRKREDRVIPIPIPIPIPVYEEVKDYEKDTAEWVRPDSYVIYHEKTPAELEETVEYEMDSEDEKFVVTINEASKKVKSTSQIVRKLPPLLTDEKMEKIIDVLEKEAFRRIHKIPSRSFLDYLGNAPFKKKPGPKPAINAVLKDIEVTRSSDDVPCVVCNDEDYDDNNLIVFCDGCDVAVHQTCYGVPQIPTTNWYCRRCEKQGKAKEKEKERELEKEKEEKEKQKEKDKEQDEKEQNDKEKEKEPEIKQEAVEENKEETSKQEEEEKEQEKEKEQKEREKEKEQKSQRDRRREDGSRDRRKKKAEEKESEEKAEGEEDFVCALCGHDGGAMKPTVNGKWAHVLCALWIPDASFMDATIMEPIDTSGISKDRFGLTCEICGTQEGCCIQCRTRYCYTAFHPYCAAQAGLLMEMRPAKGRPNSLLFKTHCKLHSEEIRAERGMEKSDKYSYILDQLSSDEIKMGLHKLVGVPLAVADAVVNYWLAKRHKAKHKDRPLISRLQMEEDALRHAAKKRRTNVQRTIQAGEEHARLRELRCHFDRAIIILDVLKKREMYKRDYIRNLQEIVDTLYPPENDGEPTPKKSSSSTSLTSPSSSLPPLRRTPTRGGTQLSIDSFLSPRSSNSNFLSSSSNTASAEKLSPRRLRDRSAPNTPSAAPSSSPPTTPRGGGSARRRILPASSPAHSSSDESLSLPGRTGRTPDRARRSAQPTNRAARSRSPDLDMSDRTRRSAQRSTRSRSPDLDVSDRARRSANRAARSQSPDLTAHSSEDEGDEADEEEDDVAESGDENMVPKRRANLRRAAANKGSYAEMNNTRKRRRRV